MELIYNSGSENHLNAIINNLKLFKKVYLATAFLKVSGVDLLLPALQKFLHDGGELIVVAGQNFALTEPEALVTLYNLIKEYANSQLYLAKADVATKIFHHKLYLFTNDKYASIISGSANITKGGLISNDESSLIFNCESTHQTWQKTLTVFNSIIEKSDIVNLLIIRQYESYFNEQKIINLNIKAIPTRTKAQIEFNYKTLLFHLQNLDEEYLKTRYNDKKSRYKLAKNVLDEIADSAKLTKTKFAKLLDQLVGSKGQERLWDSGSLFRLRKKVYDYPKEFRLLVRYIRANKTLNPNEIFDNAVQLVLPIKGAAVNYVTEIMMTYNTIDYANINRNPITVLRNEAGIPMKAHSSSFDGNDYEEYCILIKDICENLNLKDMLQADSLFNEIYWQIR